VLVDKQPDRAVQVVQSIEDTGEREGAAADLAKALAKTDPNQALEVARSIKGEFDRVRALCAVAKAVLASEVQP
jgi:hypothetical protein